MSEKKQQTAYPLRMPQALRDQLEASSAESKRSLNAEIIARLEESFQARRIHDAEHLSLHVAGREVQLAPANILAAAALHVERLALASQQMGDASRRLADLEEKSQRNSLRRLMASEAEREEINLQQMQIMSEVASLKTQTYMLEREIRAAESALGFKALVPGVKGFDPAEE